MPDFVLEVPGVEPILFSSGPTIIYHDRRVGVTTFLAFLGEQLAANGHRYLYIGEGDAPGAPLRLRLRSGFMRSVNRFLRGRDVSCVILDGPESEDEIQEFLEYSPFRIQKTILVVGTTISPLNDISIPVMSYRFDGTGKRILDVGSKYEIISDSRGIWGVKSGEEAHLSRESLLNGDWWE